MKSIKMRGVAAAVAGALMFGFGANAMADSTDDIVNALMAKGVLTEEEGALLLKGREGEKAGNAKKVKVTDKNGSFTMETGDGKNTMALTGRMQFDARSIDASGTGDTEANESSRHAASLGDNFEIRRARIGVKGKMFEHFDYEVIANAVGSNTNTIDVAYINAGMFEKAQLKLGQFKQPFNLEEYATSSNNIDFMERSYINQITPAKKPGAMIHGIPVKGITYAGSVYQQNAFGETDAESTGKGFAGRLTANIAELAGWNTKESVLHVGVAGFDSEYGVTPAGSSKGHVSGAETNGTVFAFRTEGRGLTPAYRLQIGGAATGGAGASVLSNASSNVNQSVYGLELAAAQGPFKVQAEYSAQDFDAVTKSDTAKFAKADVQAYYVEALYMLTGENYADWYKNGAWSGIKPKSNFDIETGKGKGAWEIGLRYDRYNVDNVSIGGTGSRVQGSYDGNTGSTDKTTSSKGGGAETYTAGVKWQLTPNMRVMANYSHTKFDDKFTAVDTAIANISKEDLLMVRSQFSF
ncbi:MAG: OprO/OprP family phosphate-selective porin [Burkholderiaceae bacterium]|nr:OprO/OprP family phosphate-selective porin [Burkholderiaceae bacterium]